MCSDLAVPTGIEPAPAGYPEAKPLRSGGRLHQDERLIESVRAANVALEGMQCLLAVVEGPTSALSGALESPEELKSLESFIKEVRGATGKTLQNLLGAAKRLARLGVWSPRAAIQAHAGSGDKSVAHVMLLWALR